MEGTDPAFFYTARTFGVNNTIISLTEQTHLDWVGRIAYMSAKAEKRRTELYAMDLVWLLAKKHYDIQTEQPSVCELGNSKRDRRTAEQIKKDLLKKLGE